MDESSGDEPIVLIEKDEPPPPPRRRWPWPVPAGVLLLAVLGTAALLQERRPANPPPPPATEIAFVEADPPPATEETPEPPPPPDEPIVEAPPAAPAPPPAVPKTEAAVVVKADPTHVIADPPPPPPAAPAPRVYEAVEKELAAASAALRDAEPLFREVADGFNNADPRDLAAKMDRVEQLLRNAQEGYDRLRNRAPDPETLGRRLAVLDELLEGLKEGRSRLRVPLALKQAQALHREAVLIAKVALDGFQPYSREAQALDAKAEDAAGKLREARKLFGSIRNDVPDPKTLDRRIRSIDALLDRLEKRFPSIPAAR